MFEFTKRSRKILEILAQTEARRLNSEIVSPEHIFIALLKDHDSLALKILKNIGIETEELRIILENAVKNLGSTMIMGRIPLNDSYKKVIEFARDESSRTNNVYIGTEHLLLAIIREGSCRGLTFLRDHNIDYNRIRQEIIRILGQKESVDKTPKKAPLQKPPSIDDFAIDLTKKARDGELDPVIGRDIEIARVIRILCRKQKNNPVLIGEAGVGKTAIVEGLALRIAEGNVPDLLSEAKVMALDIASIVAGTKYRGEFEDRLKKLVKEITGNKGIIIFIDEIHTIIGAGAAEGAIDAANILKPVLARGELQCIGATTINEYRMYVEKDVALARRFQSLLVEEPDINETIEIIRGLRERYETHHRVHYTDSVIVKAVHLSDRYITDRFLPDKAIDVIDEAGAFARLASQSRPDDITELENEIDLLDSEKNLRVKSQDYESAALIRDKIIELRELLQRKLQSWQKRSDEYRVTVDEKQIAEVVSEITGIPVRQLEENESRRLMDMENVLKKHIIGQDEAIVAVSRAIRRSRSGLGKRNKPSGTFIFTGPTGVGKSQMAKELASFLFNSERNIVRLDMSEFMEKHSVSRLIGSPPGYIGYDDGGQLTEKIKRRPYSVILFDEIEKAHPDVLNVLLQVLDEGELTDGSGVTVSFRDAVLIMTTNAGSNETRSHPVMGFAEKETFENLRNDRMLDHLKKVLNPEFLNRIDEIIIFNRLYREDIQKILTLMLEELTRDLNKQNIEITFSRGVKEHLCEKGFSEEYGARHLRRVIQQEIEDPLAIELLSGKWPYHPEINVIMRASAVCFSQKNSGGKSRQSNHSKKKADPVKQT